MKNLGDKIKAKTGSWTFGGKVSKTFQIHVEKSVPMYTAGHDLIEDLSEYFLTNNSKMYDIGCSTGLLLERLCKRNSKKITYIGIDSEPQMINQAKKNLRKYAKTIKLFCGSIEDIKLKKSDLIIAYYTIQFIRPRVRQQIIDKIYQALNWGGAFIMFEKVRGADARFQDIFTTLYNEFKLRNGYSEEAILNKSLSLKGVLEPFSTQANIDMLRRAGFQDINTIQKSLCFEGFLAIK